MRTVPLRNLGACIAPDNSWMFLQGIETLPLRMERHCENALAVAKHLKAHPQVEWVRFPGLEDDPMYALNQKYLKGKGGAMVVFGIKGGAEAGRKFIDSLKLFSHLANVGDAKSLAIHPATTTHASSTSEQQTAGGITPELVRLSDRHRAHRRHPRRHRPGPQGRRRLKPTTSPTADGRRRSFRVLVPSSPHRILTASFMSQTPSEAQTLFFEFDDPEIRCRCAWGRPCRGSPWPTRCTGR